MSTTESRVKEILAEQLGFEVADLNPADSLADKLRADSLDMVEIQMSLEDEFEIEVPDDFLTDVKTVQQAIDYLTAKVGA